MKNRTDIHRPSTIEPGDYDFVALRAIKIETLGDVYVIEAERARLTEHTARTGATYSHHEHGGVCHICGNGNVMYTAVFHHRATNKYIVTGMDCAEKMHMDDARRFRIFRDAIDAAREHAAGKRKAMGILIDAGVPAAWTIYNATTTDGSEEATIKDMVGKLIRYGSISEKAMNFLKVLVDRIPRRAAIAAERAAERDAAAPCPTGRVTITGTVLKTDVKESDFGTRIVMTVKADAGFIVWGTAPSGIERGMKIALTATIEPSERDPKFGFYKRPKATVLEKEAA